MRNISVTRMSDASDVSFTRLIKVLDKGGTETRAACGKIMRRSDCTYVIPIVSAASHWPFGIERMEARITSDAYAPTFNEKPMTAAGKGSIVTPSDGKP